MNRGGDWIILRTASRSTLPLAKSLAEDGFDVWTPVETGVFNVPRANVKRTISRAMLPSYVFARAGHLYNLLQLASLPSRRGPGLRRPAHESFSVMRCSDHIPLIADASLNALRKIEARRTPRQMAEEPLPVGCIVRVKAGSAGFEGMIGKVESGDRGTTLVCFNRRYTVEIPTSLLSVDEIGTDQPILADAA